MTENLIKDIIVERSVPIALVLSTPEEVAEELRDFPNRDNHERKERSEKRTHERRDCVKVIFLFEYRLVNEVAADSRGRAGNGVENSVILKNNGVKVNEVAEEGAAKLHKVDNVLRAVRQIGQKAVLRRNKVQKAQRIKRKHIDGAKRPLPVVGMHYDRIDEKQANNPPGYVFNNRHFLKNAAPDIPDALFKKFHSNLLRKRIKEKGLHKAALKPYLHIRNIQRRNRFVNKG